MNNKWALITGATSGIGRAFAFHFAKEGYNIIATGTRAEELNKVTSEIKNTLDVDAISFIGDLSQESVQNELILIAIEKKVSILINNAGFAFSKSFQDIKYEDYEKMINLHVICTVRLTHKLLKHMIKANEGCIINVSSDASYMAIPKNSVYSGTKAFIKQFSHGLYLDLIKTNVYVQALCPGFTHTDLHDKMNMSKDKQRNNALIHWEQPEQVVVNSINAMKKRKAICISGKFTKLQIFLTYIMPKKMYHKMVTSIFK